MCVVRVRRYLPASSTDNSRPLNHHSQHHSPMAIGMRREWRLCSYALHVCVESSVHFSNRNPHPTSHPPSAFLAEPDALTCSATSIDDSTASHQRFDGIAVELAFQHNHLARACVCVHPLLLVCTHARKTCTSASDRKRLMPTCLMVTYRPLLVT